MITPEIKDQILSYLCEYYELEGVCVLDNDELFEIVPVDLNELEAFIGQLKRMNLFGPDSVVVSETKTYIQIYLEAQDFLRIGGFTAREAILIQNIDKLDLEVQKLRENPSDTLATAANIAAILANVLSFFRPV